MSEYEIKVADITLCQACWSEHDDLNDESSVGFSGNARISVTNNCAKCGVYYERVISCKNNVVHLNSIE